MLLLQPRKRFNNIDHSFLHCSEIIKGVNRSHSNDLNEKCFAVHSSSSFLKTPSTWDRFVCETLRVKLWLNSKGSSMQIALRLHSSDFSLVSSFFAVRIWTTVDRKLNDSMKNDKKPIHRRETERLFSGLKNKEIFWFWNQVSYPSIINEGLGWEWSYSSLKEWKILVLNNSN